MSFTNITDEELEGKGVTGLPDTPGLSTIEMQQKFDEYSVFLKDKLKTLISELEAEAGALNIGATVPENITADGNIQSILDGLRQYVDDTVVALGTGDMATGIYDPNRDGVIAPAQGGTGQTTMQGARNAMGLGNTLNALPIENGGTGANSAAAARENLGLGNTTGPLPVINGGTGVTSREALRQFLYGDAYKVPVIGGGTGKTSVTAGSVLVGNGADEMTERTIDSTLGGTSGSNALITSGAVNAGLAELRQSFTVGCNTLANALIAQGVTPAKLGDIYTPEELADGIEQLFINNESTRKERVRINQQYSGTWAFTGSLQTISPQETIATAAIYNYASAYNNNTRTSSSPVVIEKTFHDVIYEQVNEGAYSFPRISGETGLRYLDRLLYKITSLAGSGESCLINGEYDVSRMASIIGQIPQIASDFPYEVELKERLTGAYKLICNYNHNKPGSGLDIESWSTEIYYYPNKGSSEYIGGTVALSSGSPRSPQSATTYTDLELTLSQDGGITSVEVL